MGRVRDTTPRVTQERINLLLEAVDESPKDLAQLAEESGLPTSQTAEIITEAIRQHTALILWDGQAYFRPRDAAALMDFAVTHPPYFQAVLCVWRLGFDLRLTERGK